MEITSVVRRYGNLAGFGEFSQHFTSFPLPFIFTPDAWLKSPPIYEMSTHVSTPSRDI